SGPGTLGLLSAAFGAGALIGGLAIAAMARARLRPLLIGAAGLGVSERLLAPTGSLGMALVLVFVSGGGFMLLAAKANSLLQLEAPDHLRGRVIGLYFYAFVGTGSIGGLLAGWLAAVGGTELAYAVAGLVSLVAAIAAAVALGGRERFPTRLPRAYTAGTRP